MMIKLMGIKRLKLFMAFMLLTAQFAAFASRPEMAQAADNGLGAKPYMGWSSYSQQVINSPNPWLTAENLKAQSDAMHEKLQAHGYTYINVDAGWNGGMDGYGRPIPSTDVFPDGIQDVIDHVHNNGQKFGLYVIPGLGQEAYDQDLPIYGTACTMRDIVAQPLQQSNYWGFGYKIDFTNPCAQSYINTVADQFAEWGVDFLKLDSVTPGSGINDLSMDTRDNVKAWSEALAPHNIWLELSWALDIRYADTWKEYANGWRVHWDIECYCQTLTKWDNIARLFPTAAQWWRHAGPGGWNDFDSLNIGNGAIDGLTQTERLTAMTFFAVSAVPLYSGNDLTDLDEFGLELLTNDEVIGVNQAGRPARPVSVDTNQQVWYTNNGDGTFTVALFNLGNSSATINVDWSDIGISGPASVRDLWSHSELGTFDTGYSVSELPSHGSRLLKVTVKRGTALVNDDDVGIRYSGEWLRNDDKELPGSSQSLLVNVIDSKAKNSTISTASAQFDKNTASQDDIVVNMTLNSNSLLGITSNGKSLTEGVDYNLSSNTVTVKKEYLAGLPSGNASLSFVFSGGTDSDLDITIIDTTIRDSVVLPAVLDFDKGDEVQREKTTKIAYNGNDLITIASGEIMLEEGTHYMLSGNTVTFKSAYLATLPEGTSELSFNFSGGAMQTVTLVIKDSSVGGSLSLNDDDPSIVYTGTWHPNTNRGVGDYQDDIHWTESAGDSFQYTFNGIGIELITELDSSQGLIDIYVDGEFKKTVNTNNTYRSAHHAVYNITGLPPGMHTLKVVKRAWEDKGGLFMLLDQLRVILPDLISSSARSFDKSDTTQGDVQSTVATDYQVTGVTNNGALLVEGTDYTISGSEFTVKKEYLAEQLVGAVRLVVAFDGGATQNLAINVTDSGAVNSSISPESADFDKYTAHQVDVKANMALEGNQLVGIINGGTSLSEGTDYTVSGSEVTVMKEYLASQPTDTTFLKFVFDAGESRTLEIAIRDTTPQNSSLVPEVLSFDPTVAVQSDATTAMTLNGNSLVSIVNGGKTLTAGTDYIVSGNQVTFKKEYLSTLQPGMVDLTFQFNAGEPQTLTVVVSESLRGRYVNVNNDDVSIVYKGSWNPNTNRGFGDYKDDIHWSETNGNSFEYTFKGTGIELITELDSSHGEIEIYIDGEFKQTVNTYHTSRVANRAVYNIVGLPDDEHTIKAVKKSGQFMLLDQLRIRKADIIGPDMVTFDKSEKGNTDVTTVLEFDRRNLSSILNGDEELKQGKDYTLSGNTVRIKKNYFEAQPLGTVFLTLVRRGDYQDDVHWTKTNGDFFEYSFEGTGVEIIAPTDPSQGEIDVYVDNVFLRTVSLKSDVRLSRQSVFSITKLKNGTHTIKGVKRSGKAFILDGLQFRVPPIDQ
jgi:hypothetical protein